MQAVQQLQKSQCLNFACTEEGEVGVHIPRIKFQPTIFRSRCETHGKRQILARTGRRGLTIAIPPISRYMSPLKENSTSWVHLLSSFLKCSFPCSGVVMLSAATNAFKFRGIVQNAHHLGHIVLLVREYNSRALVRFSYNKLLVRLQLMESVQILLPRGNAFRVCFVQA